MRHRLDLDLLRRQARHIMPESHDGQQPLPADLRCPVALDELLATSPRATSPQSARQQDAKDKSRESW